MESGTLEDIRIPQDAFLLGDFGGKRRYIRYDLNAFAEMERMYGSMEEADKALAKGSIQDVRKILWLGLIWDEAVLDEITGEPIRYKVSMHQVGSWLTMSNLKNVINELTKALNSSVPKDATPSDTGKVLTISAASTTGDENSWTMPSDRQEELEANHPNVVDGTGLSTYTQDS